MEWRSLTDLTVEHPPTPNSRHPIAGRLCYHTAMTKFTDLEMAALRAIFLETPELAPALERQLEASVVTERENSGGGFFTTMKGAGDTFAVNSPSVLGYATQARIGGLEHGFGFVLFIKDGMLHMLEGFAWASESTYDLDLAALQFEIYNQPVQRLG